MLNKVNVDVSVEVWHVDARFSGIDAQEGKNVSALLSKLHFFLLCSDAF